MGAPKRKSNNPMGACVVVGGGVVVQAYHLYTPFSINQ